MNAYLDRLFEILPRETMVTVTIVSLTVFVGTLIAIPFILLRLPPHYFDVRVPRMWMSNHHPVLRFLGAFVKNVLGIVFLLAGVAMLVLPGQGLLTILVGISLLDFPGKQRIEARLVGHPTVLSVINSLRSKFGRPPLVIAPNP